MCVIFLYYSIIPKIDGLLFLQISVKNQFQLVKLMYHFFSALTAICPLVAKVFKLYQQ